MHREDERYASSLHDTVEIPKVTTKPKASTKAKVSTKAATTSAGVSRWWAIPLMAMSIAMVVLAGLVFVNLRTDGADSQAEEVVEIPAPVVPSMPAVDPVAGGVAVDNPWLRETSEKSGIPKRVLQAYVAATVWAAQRSPQCGLSWNTLAGIGKIETDHGRYKGASVNDSGEVTPHLFGVQLRGEGTAHIRDTDGGRLDGDRTHDRAVGPMQFIPATWNQVAVDGNGDGTKDPHNIDDATASAAAFLCANNRNLSDLNGYTDAIKAYNPSDQYVRDVANEAQRIAQVVGQPAQSEQNGAI
ncbi:membrane-bound lytic murein transglycosylase B [Brevibacterium paucivorans]|uniref:Membrane-bound lytic murein transglycosylase B n=1 Tax=Brevibacterium paucivorans TaxID=170994 RepID=A0ABS2SI99_9MICO|nr:lytic murein transglycosylase [Brevibacterium paucivorans]MBM7815977.1 membrane-bound lytic murein transglycosylase B [Brevibacterium paucivorans]